MLDNPYYLQVLNTNKDGLVLVNTINDYQHDIPLK